MNRYTAELNKYKNKVLTQNQLLSLNKFLEEETKYREEELKKELKKLEEDIEGIKAKAIKYEKDIYTKYPEVQHIKGHYDYNTRMKVPTHSSIPSKYISENTKLEIKVPKYFYGNVTPTFSIYNKISNRKFIINHQVDIKMKDIEGSTNYKANSEITTYKISYDYDYLKSIIPESILLNNKKVYKKFLVDAYNKLTFNKSKSRESHVIINDNTWLKEEIGSLLLLS